MLARYLVGASLVVAALSVAAATSSCGDSCDEDAECSCTIFEGCRYEGCGTISCFADASLGHVICNDDGTQGCSAWPQEIAPGCEEMGTLERQAACTDLLSAVPSNPSPSNVEACRQALLAIAPCMLDQQGTGCPHEEVDAACFDFDLGCE